MTPVNDGLPNLQIGLINKKTSLCSGWWCIKLWDITSLVSVQVVGFFDVAARLCAGDGPIAALVGGSICSMGSALQDRTFNDYKNSITV